VTLVGIHEIAGGNHQLQVPKSAAPTTTEEVQADMQAATVSFIKEYILGTVENGAGGAKRKGCTKTTGAGASLTWRPDAAAAVTLAATAGMAVGSGEKRGRDGEKPVASKEGKKGRK
jgi:hypothetical protein